MKKMWAKPELDVLDVSMTMKWHGGGKDPKPEPEPNPEPNPLDS